MAICAHCSTPVADEAKFCHSCGSLVSDAEGQAAATASMDRSAFDHMERLLRDETKGVYTVGHMLGRGGMAVVYLATEVGLSRKVALKVLPPELTFGHGVERFKREARTAAALDHPHIIPIYRISDSGKLFWYAMKYLEGRSLEDLLRERGSLSVEESIDILEQVADALDYAHEHKVIHRDIKPANVMLDNRNRVIVTDFGIAKALSEGKLTATDSVIGTPYFMSPEQGMGKPVTGAADQYSVAVMAYRMLAGHVPFDGDSAIDILHKHCMFPPPSLHEAAPHLPEHVVAAVERALSKTAAERFARVSDFISAMADPDFVDKPAARASVATVVMSAAEAKAARSKSGTTGPNAKTVAAKPPVTPRPGARPKPRTGAVATVPDAVPAPKSKAGLMAAVAVVILAAGGIGAWQMTKGGEGPATVQGPTTTPIQDGPTAIPPATDAGAGGPTSATPGPQTVADAGTKQAEPVVNTPPPVETKAPVTRTPPRQNTGGRPTNPQTRPADPQTTPQQPAATPPPVSAAAKPDPVVQIRLTPPATVIVNLETRGERSTFVTTVRPGTPQVFQFQKDGFAPRDTSLTLQPGDTARFTISLQRLP